MPGDPNRYASLYLSLVPEEVRKAIRPDELNDRLAEAARLSAQANDPALSISLRKAARIRAQAVLRAQPRAVTRQQHADLVAKAAATRNPAQADAIRRHADQLLEQDHPIAPRRGGAGVRKAASDGNDPVVLFDADGRVLGICDPADITAVDGATATGELTPQPSAEAGIPAQDVAKSAGRVVVYDQRRRPYLVRGQAIRTSIRKAPDDGLVTVTGPDGRTYRLRPEVLQSADRGPVKAGGTTGMGQPRIVGPAGALPGDGPQQRRPGDVPDRQVVKARQPGRARFAGVVEAGEALIAANRRERLRRGR